MSPFRFGLPLPLALVLASTAITAGAAADPPASTAAPASPATPAPPAAAPTEPAISIETASYDIGLMVGTQLASNGIGATLSHEELIRGINEALGGKLVSSTQKDAAQAFIHAARLALGRHNAELAHVFLEKNSHESGIRTLPSGIQYRVLAAGDPKAALPGPTDQITVRYRASLPDGTVIDRSDDHAQPATFRLNSVIQGWRDALSAMVPGARWQIFVPPELGYGVNSPPPIPPGSLLVYELELLKVEPLKPMSPQMRAPLAHKQGSPQGTVQSPSATSRTPDGSANRTK
ncbi:MAG: FKBP-type peptidyl-prolyl cis-trans isomerase [Gammaproteobacteria bacterium]|nr:FKBP-type peptidyl-prolyl cis-trans isomerase [Gammaproteobacteria bacterium]